MKNARENKSFFGNLPDRLIDFHERKFLLLLGQLAVLFGGLILLVYYFHIGFLPDFDLTSLLGLLGVTAFTGILFIGLFALCFIFPVLPGFIMLNSRRGRLITRQWQRNKAKVKKGEKRKQCYSVFAIRKFSSRETILKLLRKLKNHTANWFEIKNSSTKTNSNYTKNDNYWALFQMFVFPVSLAWIVILCSSYINEFVVKINSYLSVATAEYFANNSQQIFLLLDFLIAGLVLLITSFFTYRTVLKHKYFPKIRPVDFLIYLGGLIFSFLLLSIPLLIVSSIITSPYKIQQQTGIKDFPQDAVIVVVFFLLIIFNGIQFERFANETDKNFNRKMISQIGFALFVFLAVSLISGSWLIIPEAVVRTYGLGGVENAEIVLKPDGCNTVKQLGVNFISQNEGNDCRLVHSKILSRIGSNFYIETDSGKRFSLIKEAVHSDSPDKNKPRLGVTLDEYKNDEGQYLESKIQLFNNTSNSIGKISLMIKNYDNQGKLVGKPFTTQNLVIDSNSQIKDVEGNDYIIPSDLPAEKEEKDKIGWRDVILLIEGQEQPLLLKRKIIIK